MASKNDVKVVICYAKDDNSEVREILLTKLKKEQSNLKYKLFLDEEIIIGEKWNSKIKEEFSQADIAILLLSNEFFKRSYILEKEIPIFNGKELVIFPILFASSWEEIEKSLLNNRRRKNAYKYVKDYQSTSIPSLTSIYAKERNLFEETVSSIVTQLEIQINVVRAKKKPKPGENSVKSKKDQFIRKENDLLPENSSEEKPSKSDLLKFSNQTHVLEGLSPSQLTTLEKKIGLIIGPSLQGKSRVIRKLEEEYKKDEWETKIVEINYQKQKSPVKQMLDFFSITDLKIDDGEPVEEFYKRRGRQFFQKLFVDNSYSKLALFIDTTGNIWGDSEESIYESINEFLNFLNGVFSKAFERNKAVYSIFRIFITSNSRILFSFMHNRSDLVEQPVVINLLPLRYEHTLDAIKKVLEENKIGTDSLDVYGHIFFYYSCGYPEILSRILSLYRQAYRIDESILLHDFLSKFVLSDWPKMLQEYFNEVGTDLVRLYKKSENFKSISLFSYFTEDIVEAYLKTNNPKMTTEDIIGEIVNKLGVYEADRENTAVFCNGNLRDLVVFHFAINKADDFQQLSQEALKLISEKMATEYGVVQIMLAIEALALIIMIALSINKGNIMNTTNIETIQENVGILFKEFQNDFAEHLPGKYRKDDIQNKLWGEVIKKLKNPSFQNNQISLLKFLIGEIYCIKGETAQISEKDFILVGIEEFEKKVVVIQEDKNGYSIYQS